MPSLPIAVPVLRLGVLGCANIARQFVRDVQGSAFVQVVAVASRDAAKATAFAREWNVPRHHARYEDLLADDTVDAVYVPLPNSLHAPWCLKAMAAGKHVLCEKPLTLGRREAEQLFAAARQHGVMLLEAYPYWFQPQTRDLLALLEGGADSVLGEVRSVQASFGFTLARPEGNIRMDPQLGGGALLDAGSYPLSLIRLVMGCAPCEVVAQARAATTGVDIATSATLLYEDGRTAQMSCAMDAATHRHATVVGSRGVVHTEYLNHTHAGDHPHPWGYLPSRMRVRRGTLNSVPFEPVHSATGSGFAFAAEAFARVVAAQDRAAIERAAQASIDIAATIEAVARSARTGRAVRL